jgi:hypothetical protein
MEIFEVGIRIVASCELGRNNLGKTEKCVGALLEERTLQLIAFRLNDEGAIVNGGLSVGQGIADRAQSRVDGEYKGRIGVGHLSPVNTFELSASHSHNLLNRRHSTTELGQQRDIILLKSNEHRI